jgi:hypothetical protein
MLGTSPSMTIEKRAGPVIRPILPSRGAGGEPDGEELALAFLDVGDVARRMA